MINEVVLVHEEMLPRGAWRLGKIVELTGTDAIRAATVKLATGKTVTRPANLLYPLEVSDANHLEDNKLPEVVAEPTVKNHGHKMITRSKAKLPRSNLLFSCLTIMMYISSASANKCPNNASIYKTLLYVENCSEQGIAVAKTNNGICWFTITCPLGHTRVKYPFTPNSGYCGKACACPKWTNTCSFYDGDLRAKSSQTEMPAELINYKPPHVCSFTPSDECSKANRIGIFEQIQLFDGTLIIVPQLTVTMRDYYTEDDFICYSNKGERKPRITPYSGTTAFCKDHSCSTTYDVFCVYPSKIAVYEFSELHHIVIEAYGSTGREYYPPLETTKPPTDESLFKSSCAKGGTRIISEPFDLLESCIRNACFYINNSTEIEQNLYFPTKYVINNYNVIHRVWKDGILLHEESIECQAQPICEIILCTFCWEHLLNKQCWSYKDGMILSALWLVIFILYYLGVLLMPFVILLTCIVRLLKLPLLPLYWIYKKYCFCKPNATLPETYRHLHKYRRRQRRRDLKFAAIATIVLQLMSTTVHACNTVTSFSAKTSECFLSAQEENCTFQETTVLTLEPMGQSTCLVLRNSQNIPVGTLSMTIEGVFSTCNKKISYFTRDHGFKLDSNHRCYRAGSCQPDRCDTTKPKDDLDEFSHQARTSPGFTHCSSACSCCDFCFLCYPSCLFWRLFAVPTSTQIYEIFTCPTWQMNVQGKLILETDTDKKSFDFTLFPGRKLSWNNIQLTLLSVSTPPTSLTARTFLTDYKRTSMVEASPPGQLLARSVGQLQCHSKKDAENFNCYFAADLCDCTPANSQTTCACPPGLTSSFLKYHTLPLSTDGILIQEQKKQVIYRHTTGSAIQIQTSVNDLQISTRQHSNKCNVSFEEVRGCYSCLAGGFLVINCTTDFGEHMAELNCLSQRTIIKCTITGFNNRATLFYTAPDVNDQCQLKCPQTL